MKTNRKVLLAILSVIVYSYSSAQPYVDIVNLQYQQFGNDDNRTREYSTSIFLPLEIKSGSHVLFGSSFRNLSFDHQQDSITATDLSSLSLQLGVSKTWNSQWSTTVMVLPRINSDFQDISSRDYQLGGFLLMTKNVNDKFKYKFGVYYNREFFGNFFVPLIGFDWYISERLKVFGVLPGKLNAEYRLSNKLYTGISYRSVTSSYRLGDDLGHNYVREGSESFGLSQMKVFLNYYPIDKLVIYTEVGHTSFREYKIHPDSGSGQPEQLFTDFGNSVLINVGASLRVRFDRD